MSSSRADSWFHWSIPLSYTSKAWFTWTFWNCGGGHCRRCLILATSINLETDSVSSFPEMSGVEFALRLQHEVSCDSEYKQGKTSKTSSKNNLKVCRQPH